MKLELNVVKKEFVNDNGEKIPYTAYEVELEGQKFNFVPRTEDKKLLNYLLAKKEREAEALSLDQLSIPGVKK